MMKRSVAVYNLRDRTEVIVDGVRAAQELSGKSYRFIKDQLEDKNARIHEVVKQIKDGTLSPVLEAVISRTQDYEFHYVQEFAIRVTEVLPTISGSFIPTDNIRMYNDVQTLCDFLGVSKQTVYNRRCTKTSAFRPIKGIDGKYYSLEFDKNFGDDASFSDTTVAGTKCFAVRLKSSGVDAPIYNLFYDVYSMYRYILENATIDLGFEYSFFYLTCGQLIATPNKMRSDFLEDTEELFIEAFNNPKSCRFAVVLASDYVGNSISLLRLE